MSLEIISINKISFGSNLNDVLNDVTFSVNAGDFVSIVGPNGSGKTTLIRLILGLICPTIGKISIFSEEPNKFNDWRKIGYMPQKLTSGNIHFPATVDEVVGLGLLSKKITPKSFNKSDEAKINEVLTSLGIAEIKDKLIGELSGGQQQRVFLARALVNNPELLILDEPTAALDLTTANAFLTSMKELNTGKGVTILLVTHDISNIGKYANKLLYLDREVIFYGTFDDFCLSTSAELYFGKFAQHIICHKHDLECQ